MGSGQPQTRQPGRQVCHWQDSHEPRSPGLGRERPRCSSDNVSHNGHCHPHRTDKDLPKLTQPQLLKAAHDSLRASLLSLCKGHGLQKWQNPVPRRQSVNTDFFWGNEGPKRPVWFRSILSRNSYGRKFNLLTWEQPPSALFLSHLRKALLLRQKTNINLHPQWPPWESWELTELTRAFCISVLWVSCDHLPCEKYIQTQLRPACGQTSLSSCWTFPSVASPSAYQHMLLAEGPQYV